MIDIDQLLAFIHLREKNNNSQIILEQYQEIGNVLHCQHYLYSSGIAFHELTMTMYRIY